VRHKFELIFLEVSAKNIGLFFFKSLREQNITSPLTAVSDAYESHRRYGNSVGILKIIADDDHPVPGLGGDLPIPASMLVLFSARGWRAHVIVADL